jgi:plasmid replication initiation protein
MKLLPERHPVRDFFVLDVLDVAPRSDMASMAHPVFSLSTKPETRILRYENDGVIVEIHPSSKGLATIFDKDVLIYCVSKLMHMKNQGQEIGPNVRITTHDLLVSTNRLTGGIFYERLEHALDRLAGTRIKTNIETGDEKTTQNFGLIDSYDYNRKGSGFAERLRHLDIKLSDWLFRAIEAAEVLPISRDYFRLRSPLDRRIYEVGRKHCGRQEKWRISVDKLQQRTGSKQERKHFVAHLRGLAQSNHLPDYALTLEEEQAVFWRRAGEGAGVSRCLTAPGSIPAAVEQAPGAAAVSAAPGEHKILLSAAAIEEAKKIAGRLDPYWLENTYIEWAKTLDEPARNEDARFLSWVKSFTKRKPAT